MDVLPDAQSFDQLLTKEWLLTNGRGGYASSTIIGCDTRRYHGLLIGSLSPPVKRIVALSNCLETVACAAGAFELSSFEFNGVFHPQGYRYLRRFRRDIAVHLEYQLPVAKVTKSIYLLPQVDTVAVAYEFSGLAEPIQFTLRPFAALRDFHSLLKSGDSLTCERAEGDILICRRAPGYGELFIKCPGGDFEQDEQWWHNLVYRRENEAGQDFTEDLWSPGAFNWKVSGPTTVVLWAGLVDKVDPGELTLPTLDAVRSSLWRQYRKIAAPAKDDSTRAALFIAADQFVVQRRRSQTILAGYPWFADWGRDAFVALPGLLLATQRFDEAKSVLETFAAATTEGMIPNCFDDYDGTPHYNSIDASLWFINAAFEYLKATADVKMFRDRLLGVVLSIVDSYQQGTRFNIRSDSDGLITGGSSETQLTWMDAKYEGVAFTPRYGKCVEVNALWYNAIMRLARFCAEYGSIGPEQKVGTYERLAAKVKGSFCNLFWNETTGYLNDCVLPDGSLDTSLRPNQIFAVSLPFSPLAAEQQERVVRIVGERLLTPCGLRTLDAADPRYIGIYAGPRRQRDMAYHQGTVWPWLLGPFVEAYLKVHNFSRESKNTAAKLLKPLITHLTQDACLGQVSEIFDGTPPHHSRGCFAQAWSVAELIRAYLLVSA